MLSVSSPTLSRRPSSRLVQLSEDECRREGFETFEAMAKYWWGLHVNWDPTQLVDRIEFELVPDSRTGS